jgi:hypothetical protein
MTYSTKLKINKLIVLLPGLTLAVNFGFCPMALAAPTVVGIFGIEQEVTLVANVSDNFTCENQNSPPPSQPTTSHSAAEQTSGTQHSQPLPPCCLEMSGKASLSNFYLFDFGDTLVITPFTNSASEISTDNFSLPVSFDLPPPESSILASVFKKE